MPEPQWSVQRLCRRVFAPEVPHSGETQSCAVGNLFLMLNTNPEKIRLEAFLYSSHSQSLLHELDSQPSQLIMAYHLDAAIAIWEFPW